MAKDLRLVNSAGQKVDFTCCNSRFRTKLKKGFNHLPLRQADGSVFPSSLIPVSPTNPPPYTLWLEYVDEIATGDEYYWFMWYKLGRPVIPMSGVFDKKQLVELLGQLATFVP